MKEENHELERERLELEKQKLEFEKEKFKHEMSVSKESKTTNSPILKGTNPLNKLGVVFSAIMVVSVFLPWAGMETSGLGLSASFSASGIYSSQGILTLIGGILGVLFAFKRNKYDSVPGVLGALLSLSFILGLGKVSASYGGVSTSAGISFGPIVALIGSLGQIISCFLKSSINKDNSSSALKDFYVKHEQNILVVVAVICSLLFVLIEFSNVRGILEYLVFLGLASVPIFVFRKLDKHHLIKVYSVIIFSYVLVLFLQRYIRGTLFSGNNAFTRFIVTISESIYLTESWIKVVCFVGVLGLIVSLSKSRNGGFVSKLSSFSFYRKVWIAPLLMYFPFLILSLWYSYSRVILTDEDINSFREINSEYMGDWFFLNPDSSQIIRLNLSMNGEIYETQKYSGNLSTQITYSIDSESNQKSFGYGYQIFRSKYNSKFQFPLSFEGGFTISTVSKNELTFSIPSNDGKISKFKALRNLALLEEILLEKAKQSNPTISQVNPHNIFIGTWKGDMGGKTLSIVIEKVSGNRLEGYNVYGTNKRPITGTFERGSFDQPCAMAFDAVLKEPGDDSWDGVFEVQFIAYQDWDDSGQNLECSGEFKGTEAGGVWLSNNGKTQKDFFLEKQK